jgi:hypothetical protein
MTITAEIKVLRKGLEKFLEPIADKGTWNPGTTKHHRIRCKYDGCPLDFSFPKSPKKKLSMKAVYKQVKQKLAHCGLVPPSKLKLKMVVRYDTDYYLDQLFDFLEAQEKLFTGRPSTGVSAAKGYIREAHKTQRARVRSLQQDKKPYKKKISYDKVGGVVSYDRYYSWMKKKFRDGNFRQGYLQVSKGTYLEALVMWKEQNK